MTTLEIKNRLRETVEAASGGAQTVRYTTKGQPCFMNVIKKFNLSTVIPTMSGVHPAFLVGGVEVPQILIGTYQMTISNGEMVSQPYRSPTTGITQADAVQAARFSGAGFHVMTNAEWSALQCLSFINRTYPKGNNKFGMDSESPSRYGTRVDGMVVGTASGKGVIYTGSGPSDFRHDLSYNGICDLNGNINEMVTGLRCVNGELQIIFDNNAASSDFSVGPSGSSWRAISGIDGTALMPNGSGTTPGAIRLVASGTGTTQDYTLAFFEGVFSVDKVLNSTSKPVTTLALNVLKSLGLYPFVSSAKDFMALNPTVTGYANRGGFWNNPGNSGINALTLANMYDNVADSLGSRLAFYNVP